MSFEITPATRKGLVPLIDLFSESGCGKTMSSLLLARGLAGPTGKIVMADSESKRGSLYADVIPGGYDVINFTDPFSPATYCEITQAIYNSGAAVGIIDSGSHEWEGLGGVLDMAADNEAKSGKSGLHNWRTPKFEHAKWIQMLLRAPIPMIVCIRAKFKTRQGKDERGKTCIIRDDYTSPIQSEEFIFEATAHAEILHDHSIRLTKCSHPDLRKCFPEKGPITVEHGKLIAEWCAAPKGPGTQRPSTSLAKLKKELWIMTTKIHNGDPRALNQWLLDECIISDTESLETLIEERFPDVLKKSFDKLSQPTTQ